MYHRKTYMYNNFQQNEVSRSFKIVHTNLFAKNFNYLLLKILIIATLLLWVNLLPGKFYKHALVDPF